MRELLKDWYEAEKEKMSEMTKEEKMDYIITYYKGWLILAAILLLLLIWIPCHFIFGNEKQGFLCGAVNCVTTRGGIALSDDLDAYFNFENKKEYAYFDTDYQIAYPGVDNEAADNSFYEKFFLNIRIGALDAAIMPLSYMEYCKSLECMFYDVTEVLDGEQIEKYQSLFVTGKDEEGNEYICGIDISGFAFIEKEEVSFVNANRGEIFVLAFPVTGKQQERCRQFVNFLGKYEE